jgi:hypothetical protein
MPNWSAVLKEIQESPARSFQLRNPEPKDLFSDF